MFKDLALVVRPVKAARRWRRRRTLVQRARQMPRRVVVGASGVAQPDWIATDIDQLNLLKPARWRRYFAEESIDALLAEHVWEHLSAADGIRAAETCYRFLKPGGYLRAAVPDGLHPNEAYREWVRPGGSGPGADDHKVLYTYQTFRQIFQSAGFTVTLLEYFDERGEFQYQAWDPQQGMIHRSSRFDKRNQEAPLSYTSLILDARKAA